MLATFSVSLRSTWDVNLWTCKNDTHLRRLCWHYVRFMVENGGEGIKVEKMLQGSPSTGVSHPQRFYKSDWRKPQTDIQTRGVEGLSLHRSSCELHSSLYTQNQLGKPLGFKNNFLCLGIAEKRRRSQYSSQSWKAGRPFKWQRADLGTKIES